MKQTLWTIQHIDAYVASEESRVLHGKIEVKGNLA